MADFNFDVNAGESLTLLTAGKYCKDNIVVNAIGGGEGGGGGDSAIHVVTKDCDNAAEVVAYFKALLPSGSSDMIVSLKPPAGLAALSKMENGQMLTLVINGSKAGYARWYSNAVNVQTTFSTSYTCKCWVGDEYYICPLV